MEYREFRASVEGDDTGHVHGLVTPFGRETVIGDLKRGGFKETVREGAFRKTLDEGDPLMVWQHRMDQPLARKSAGNLELREGEKDGQRGVVVDADPVDTSYARDMKALVRAKVVTGMSFGFEVIKDAWTDDEGNPSNRHVGTRRELLEVRCIEVSPVTLPAYGGTSIQMRDAQTAALLEERAGNPKPYGDVKYADPKNGKYPVDTEEHARAAWSYINMPKNAAKYPLNGVTLSEVKAKIRAALKHFGIKTSEQNDAGEPDELRDAYEDEFYETEQRDDPDGDEYAAIDEAVRSLQEDPPDVKAALKTLKANQAQRSQTPGEETPEPEPDTSTRDDEDDFALRVKERETVERSRELGLV